MKLIKEIKKLRNTITAMYIVLTAIAGFTLFGVISNNELLNNVIYRKLDSELHYVRTDEKAD